MKTSRSALHPVIIPVRGGPFTMGDPHGEISEQPIHKVILNNFSITETAVTVRQWKDYCTASGHKMPEEPNWGWNDDHPMVNISWQDAVAYCNWMSEKKGKLYRLPTEAEWEYAACGGEQCNGYKYSGGNILENVGWFEINSKNQTQPVAQKQPNELGIYDMSGNVWEWCNDWYSKSYYANSPATSPKGPSMGACRVLRGGAWDFVAAGCRIAYRHYSSPGYRHFNRGFRAVIPG